MKHLKSFQVFVLESIKNVEDWDEQYQSYEFTDKGISYFIFIEQKTYGDKSIKTFVRFKTKSGTYDDLTKLNNTISVFNNVKLAIDDYSKRFNIHEFWMHPSDEKRKSVWKSLLIRANFMVQDEANGNVKIMKNNIREAFVKMMEKSETNKAYLKGLPSKKKKEMKMEIEKNKNKKDNDPSAYTDWIADKNDKTGKKWKTKTSKHTNKFKEKYG